MHTLFGITLVLYKYGNTVNSIKVDIDNGQMCTMSAQMMWGKAEKYTFN